ncbi:MAG: LysE family translocator [Syntrophaceae bacterium]|nr:LysE family translocator [Syntrophaceae bacterium]
MWVYLIQGIGYGFAAAVQPGPFQTFLIAQTLSHGWRQALPAALAPLISDGPIILLTLLVLSQVPVWFQRVLYTAGGLFILYLAYHALVAWRNFDEAGLATHSASRQGIVRAAMINALNPGPYIFWSLVTGPILLAAWRQAPVQGLGFLVSFYVAIVLSLSGIVLVFGTARRLGPKVIRLLFGVSAITLAGFGLYQLWLGLGEGVC